MTMSKFTEFSGLYDAKHELEKKMSEVDKEIAKRKAEDPELERFAKEFLEGSKSFLEKEKKAKKRKGGEEDERKAAEKKARIHQLRDWNKMKQKWDRGKSLSEEEVERGVTGGLEQGKPIPEELSDRWVGESEERRRMVNASRHAGGLDPSRMDSSNAGGE